MKITFQNAHKLRCGNTVWRCMALPNGVAHIEEALLRGKKVIHVFRAYLSNTACTARRIKPKTDEYRGAHFLNDIHGHGSERIAAFTTRREALRWKAEVESSDLRHGAVLAAIVHAHEEALWNDLWNDLYEDCYDDGPYNGPDNQQAAYTKPTTLGELLRQKLDQIDAEKASGA